MNQNNRRIIHFADRAAKLETPKISAVPAGSIDFTAGYANPDELPNLSEIASRVLRDNRTEVLQYSPTLGLQDLRDWIVEYSREDGINLDSDNVIIVNGAKHGLDLVCKVFVNPGDAVVVTTPMYESAIKIFKGYEVNFIEIEQDEEGMNVPNLEELLNDLQKQGRQAPKIIYDVSDFHNPSGITISRRRREHLIDVATRHGIIITEDSPYRRIRFEGRDVPPIKSFDSAGCVIGLGTFSKIVSPGLRVGWVTASAEIIKKMAMLKSDMGSCPLTQRIIYEYCRDGYLPGHIETIKRVTRQHRDLMVKGVHKHLPGSSFRIPRGGYYLWIKLPERVDSDEFLEISHRYKVAYHSGSSYYATKGSMNYIRLSYSYSDLKDIEEGMARLGSAFQE